MDLKELKDIRARRHPWETARVKAVSQIIGPLLCDGIKVLDMGAGDGFASGSLFSHLKAKEITAVDINLTDERIRELENATGGIRYLKELSAKERFDLVLLLDVMEHVEDDRGFFSGIVDKHLGRGSKMMLTVPAFQSLYSGHDAFLGHYRRYTLPGLETVVKAGGTRVIDSGYLFASLLLPKLILFKLMNVTDGSDGVGNWGAGKGVTALIESGLNADNNISMFLGRLGIKLPGLTAWVLCEKIRDDDSSSCPVMPCRVSPGVR